MRKCTSATLLAVQRGQGQWLRDGVGWKERSMNDVFVSGDGVGELTGYILFGWGLV